MFGVVLLVEDAKTNCFNFSELEGHCCWPKDTFSAREQNSSVQLEGAVTLETLWDHLFTREARNFAYGQESIYCTHSNGKAT